MGTCAMSMSFPCCLVADNVDSLFVIYQEPDYSWKNTLEDWKVIDKLQ